MEKDVKIGLVIGLIFVVALIAFFAWRQHAQIPAPPTDNTAVQEFQKTFGQNTPTPTSGTDNTMTAPAAPPAGIPPGGTPPTPPTAAAAPETAAAESTTYVVQKGDSLWKIAEKVYHDGTKFNVIYEANKNAIKDKDNLTIGMKLTIPPAPAKTESARAEQAGTGAQKYVVKKGDTYWSLAETFYHDGSKSKLIEEANPGLKPEDLKVGMTINIPAGEKKAPAAPGPDPAPAPAPAPTTP